MAQRNTFCKLGINVTVSSSYCILRVNWSCIGVRVYVPVRVRVCDP